MSGSRANRLIEGGLWLRLSGDLAWSQMLFEEASRLDPKSPALQKAQRASNLPGGIRSHQELWALLPISVTAWPNPFASPYSSVPVMASPESWNRGMVSRPPEEGAAAFPEINVEPVEFEELEPPQERKSRSATGPSDLDYLLHAAQEFLELEDPEAAIGLIVKAEKIAPDHPRLRKLRERSEAALQTLYEFKLGSLAAVPRVAISAEQIVALRLDHRAGFVLSQIDGSLSFEDLFSLSGMSRLDTSRILSQLLELKVISRA
jgi:hypothetical protein